MAKQIKEILDNISLSENPSNIIYQGKDYLTTSFIKAAVIKWELDKEKFSEILLKHIDVLKKNHINRIQLLNLPSEVDFKFWEPFKFWSDGDAENIYVCINKDTNTYNKLEMPKDKKKPMFVASLYNFGESSIKIHHELENLRQDIILNPEKYLFSKPIGFKYNNKEKDLKWEKYPDTLGDYFASSNSKMAEQSGLIFNELPVAFSNDPTVPNLGYFDIENVTADSMETPNWDSFLTQFREDQKERFMAFVYSIFDASNKGRQIVYIRSKGFSGKTFAINAISDYLGSRNTAALKTEQIQSQFFGSFIYGKRLAVWDDCKNPAIFKYGNIQSVSGSGKIPVEYKGKTAFVAENHLKFLITSNFPPEVELNAKNEETRILYFELQSYPEEELKKFMKIDKDGNLIKTNFGSYIPNTDGKFKQHLISEMPAFLIKCKKYYDIHCPKKCDIYPSNEMISDIMNHCQSEKSLVYQNIFESNFIKTDDPNDIVYNDDIHKIFARFPESISFDGFSKYLSLIDIQPVVKNIDGKTKRGRMGIKLKSFASLDKASTDIRNEVEDIVEDM